jgi:hypothetical protein
MPAKGEKLPAGLIAKFAEWIDMGAPYGEVLLDSKLAGGEMQITDSDREYWAFVPLKMTSVPKVKNSQWVSNEIDHFVLSKLEAAGLQPNNPAQHRALLRRLYFDIIGLPPAPEEVANFLAAADGNPRAALESVVDQLLNSPHYGERWGRHWLDLARYADSFGFEQDTDRNHAYHYRDFVIKALNDDMPYNQFVRWQIAGDEIAPENPLAYKLIVWHIIIERLDDKIAIVIGMVPVGVLLKPKTVSITRKIQPMAPPTLTVMWRIQQLVHHALECCTRISICCGQEICDLLRCWRQANDVKVESTQQSTVLCRVVGLEPGSLELR